MAARPSESLQGDTAGIKSLLTVDISSTDQDLPRVSRGIYVGVTGDVVVHACDDAAAVTLKGLAAGIWHPVQAQKIVRTGTTATDIVVGF